MKQLVVGFKGKAKDLKEMIEDKERIENLHKKYDFKCENHIVNTDSGKYFIDYEKFGK